MVVVHFEMSFTVEIVVIKVQDFTVKEVKIEMELKVMKINLDLEAVKQAKFVNLVEKVIEKVRRRY